MKQLFCLIVCFGLIAGCQPPAGTGPEGGTENGGADSSNTTDTSALLDAPGTTVNTSVVKYEVPGMSCPHGCTAAVKETLAAQSGVDDVAIEFESKTVTCRVRPEFDSQKALAALQTNSQFADSRLVD